MRRLFIGLACGCLVCLAVIIPALASSSPDHPAYTVQQIVTALRAHPRAWLGRTVYVRGIPMTLSTGSPQPMTQALLVEAGSSADIATYPFGGQSMVIDYPGLVPAILLDGPAPNSFVKTIIIVLKRLSGHLSAADNTGTYQVRLLRTHPCPPGFTGFCPTGTIIP